MSGLQVVLERSYSNPAMTAVKDGLDRFFIPMMLERCESFGVAIANPSHQRGYDKCWQDPVELIWVTAGAGKQGVGRIANAACMIRLAARTNMDRLGLQLHGKKSLRDSVGDQSVESSVDVVYGDFDFGGTIFLERGSVRFLIAVNGLSETENCIAAATAGMYAAQALHEAGLMSQLALA